jgi:putative protein-disulfide isomerase
MTVDRLFYLYDPLCGWCYGSVPAVRSLAASGACAVDALPSGLFAGNPFRRIDPAFVQHIVQADARIAALSGRSFSDAYRRDVLGNSVSPFDSGPATQALSAVARWNAARELDALDALQRERYVHGRDLSDRRVIAQALAGTLGDVADWLDRLADPALPAATQARTHRARQLMQATRSQGVPALVWPAPDGLRALPTSWLYGDVPLAQRLHAMT